MRPTNTVNNEQQDIRGISVITPLPMGEGTGEGPLFPLYLYNLPALSID